MTEKWSRSVWSRGLSMWRAARNDHLVNHITATPTRIDEVSHEDHHAPLLLTTLLLACQPTGQEMTGQEMTETARAAVEEEVLSVAHAFWDAAESMEDEKERRRLEGDPQPHVVCERPS